MLQHVSVKGKQVTDKRGTNIEINTINSSDVMELHRAIGEDLSHTMDYLEKDNARLKQRIVELEASLSLHPLFTKPLSIFQPIENSSSQFDKITCLY